MRLKREEWFWDCKMFCIYSPFSIIVFSVFSPWNDFFYMETRVIFCKFVEKRKYFVFRIISLKKRRKNHMAAVLLQVISSFYAIHSKNCLFIHKKRIWKTPYEKDYCISSHDDKIFFLPFCIFQNILKHTLKKCCKLWKHSALPNSTRIFKNPFSEKIVAKFGQVFDKV